MLEPPRLEELNHLFEKLSPEERDELLQCLLTAAPCGGEAMIEVLEQLLLLSCDRGVAGRAGRALDRILQPSCLQIKAEVPKKKQGMRRQSRLTTISASL